MITFLRRNFHRLARLALRIYWFVFRPKACRARCLILNRGKVLMVKNIHGRGKWTFPGGGLKRKESPEEAARREVKEEVAVALPRIFKIGSYQSRRHYRRDTVYCYLSEIDFWDFKTDPFEIAEAKWFDLNSLPSDSSPSALEMIEMYKSRKFQ